ncbi:hypothetical protein E8E15_001452 [Penicillium rubens]|nr:hypothetical protein E8E15_001452 [Penicillium rubens]
MLAVRSRPLRLKHKPDSVLTNTSTDLANPSELLITKEEATELIDRWSKSGRSFFTKEALQELGEQVRTKRTKGDKITVRSLTGVSFEGTVNLGHRFRDKFHLKRECTYIYKDLAIEYNHPEKLKLDVQKSILDDCTRASALTPLRVTHQVYPVDQEKVRGYEFARDIFKRKCVSWEESVTRANFEEILKEAEGHKINNVVGLACGSLSRPYRYNSAVQHALLITVKNWLETNGLDEKELSCYAQDPEYTDVDRRILHDVGFQVVDDPDGFLKVDEQSIVLSIAANIPVKHIIADIARPAIVIWLEVEETNNDRLLDPDSERTMKMMEGYTRCRLAEPGEAPTLEEAVEIIDRLYESGVPLFTKALIQDIWDQIKQDPALGDKILTKDITGAVVECEVEKGKVRQWQVDNTDIEYVYKELVLSYDCRASLRNEVKRRDYPLSHWRPCPIKLMHRTYEWDSKTETIIPRRGPLEDFGVVTKTFQDKAQEWKESPACENLKTILSSSAKNHDINKVIAFSLGTMSRQYFNEDGSLYTEDGCRSASQHALLVTIMEWLKERDNKEKVLCYSQEPAYSEVDEKILDEAGIEMIEDPRGWLEVDEHSIVLSIASNVPSKEIIADISRPAVIIWCRVAFCDGLEQGFTDPDSSRVRAMMEGYELHEFGPDKEMFSDIVLYIRKSVAAPIASSDGRFS